MSYFLFPKIPDNQLIDTLIFPCFDNDNSKKPSINKTLTYYLIKSKTEIDNRQIEWDRIKKFTNPYEFIHTVIPGMKTAICRHLPLSRSYFKMIEICGLLNLLDDYVRPINCFSLAEGPGGFIEALCEMRENSKDKYYGMTLLRDDTSIPGWKKSKAFLIKYSNVYLENGDTEDGDILNEKNLIYCYKKYQNSMDLITGDGGFDFSLDFNRQETVSSKLIFAQISFAIGMQKIGGNFIIKFFDTFTKVSIDMIYLLLNLYENVYIMKPNTSRPANSEKYIICKNFRQKNTKELIDKCCEILKNLEYKNLASLFNEELPYIYISRLEELNAILGQQQIENITLTLNLIDNYKNDKLESIKKNNIQKCIVWCQKYKLPYYKCSITNNQFLYKE